MEAWNHWGWQDSYVKDLHHIEVWLCSTSQSAAFFAWDVIQNVEIAHEVDVVGCEDQNEEDWDYLVSQIHDQENDELKRKSG